MRKDCGCALLNQLFSERIAAVAAPVADQRQCRVIRNTVRKERLLMTARAVIRLVLSEGPAISQWFLASSESSVRWLVRLPFYRVDNEGMEES
jgi:hypothetical protein